MDLLRKVRTLVGALARKPFTPRPEKVTLAADPDQPPSGEGRQERRALEGPEEAPSDVERVSDTERVSDLIMQRKRNEAG